MQIDLLGTPGGEVGLISNHAFESAPSGVIFDVGDRSLTIEYGKSMETLRMNVAVAEDFVDWLKASPVIYIGAVEKERMVQAFQAPLVKVSIDEADDFYYDQTQRGVGYIQTWLAQARHAQPVHRDNLSDESSSRGILYNVQLANMKVTPQLAQELVQKQALERQSAPRHAPVMAPPSLGPGSLPMQNLTANRMPKPPTPMSDEE